MLKRFVLFVLLISVTEAFAQERWDTVYQPRVHMGLPFRVMPPVEFTDEKTYPVIISLHGAGGKGVCKLGHWQSYSLEALCA